MTNHHDKPTPKFWNSIIMRYNKSKVSRSAWQLVNSLGVYLLLWVLIVFTMQISPWLAIPLILINAGFLIRVFIIFHDCGHGSFFTSKKLNVIVGKACGIFAFTPYHKWTDNHRLHHQTVGNLDKRGLGDVWTLTVDEYLVRSPLKKFLYRLFRHPVFMILIGGPLNFVLLNRFTSRKLTKKQKLNVYFTNVMLALLISVAILLIGWKTFLFIQLPMIYFAAVGGVYLFYLQHQYEDVQWARNEDWNYHEMALHGSSFFKLPVVLRWFTGNIGYHHIHHLGPTIPNYNLVKCHEENPIFKQVEPITLFKSFHSLKLRLWDEKNQRIISFRELHSMTGT
jgi:omega-6 fatty acid desaturase (delta-12 desaturase)